jgi:UDP-N-acetylglucosamine 2-epimerase
MGIASAMLGNSSSGLIEAPAVDLPVVNVGDRQAGRHREANVIDVGMQSSEIAEALTRALLPATRESLQEAHLPLLDGRAGERIASIIGSWEPPRPPRKLPIT